jgi:hypothetical protein
LVNFSRAWPPPPLSGSDRDFIRDVAAAGSPPTFVSEPSHGKVTDEWEIYLSRRFEAADGRLLGFVVSAIEIGYFERFYARLPLTGGGAFALYRRDGLLLARYPHLDYQIGKTFADTVNFNRVLAALDGGVIRQISLLNGGDRLEVPHALPHFPLFIVVSGAMDSILGSWREEIRILIAAAVLLELVLAGTTLLATRHLRGHEKLKPHGLGPRPISPSPMSESGPSAS